MKARIGLSCKLLCLWAPKKYAAHVWQNSVHVWLLIRSSPSTKELHVFESPSTKELHGFETPSTKELHGFESPSTKELPLTWERNQPKVKIKIYLHVLKYRHLKKLLDEEFNSNLKKLIDRTLLNHRLQFHYKKSCLIGWLFISEYFCSGLTYFIKVVQLSITSLESQWQENCLNYDSKVVIFDHGPFIR